MFGNKTVYQAKYGRKAGDALKGMDNLLAGGAIGGVGALGAVGMVNRLVGDVEDQLKDLYILASDERLPADIREKALDDMSKITKATGIKFDPLLGARKL